MFVTDDYREQQAALHATGTYGVMGRSFGPLVSRIAEDYGCKTLLDYGCGSRQSLRSGLVCQIEYCGYDPCVVDYAREPHPADMVACIDVLEHVEPQFTDDVIRDIRRLTRTVAVVSIHTGQAQKTLPDGRNAHIVQRPPRWWLPKFCEGFDIRDMGRTPGGFYLVLEPVNGD